MTKVAIGTEFRSVIADCNALWRVTRRIATGYYEAVCVNEPFVVNGQRLDSDFAGKTQAFKADDIARSVRVANYFTRTMADHDAWWAAQPEGSTVHYHNGFGEYIRGVVTVGADGTHKMRAVVLVGDWPSFHVDAGLRRITAGDLMQPNVTCMYGSPRFVGPKGPNAGGDPTTMTPTRITSDRTNS